MCNKIFISHTSADNDLVDSFVKNILRIGAGLSDKNIFYASSLTTGVPSGSNLMEVLRNEAKNSPLVIAVITPEYLKRPICMMEFGAAWANGVISPFLAPGFKIPKTEYFLQGMVIRPIDDRSALNELSEKIRKMGMGYNLTANTFDSGVQDFLSYIDKNDFLSMPSGDNKDNMETREISQQVDLEVYKNTPNVSNLNNIKSKFEHLRKEVIDKNKVVGEAVADAIWHDISYSDNILESRIKDQHKYDQVMKEVHNGRLKFDSEENIVYLDDESFEFIDIYEAREASEKLYCYLLDLKKQKNDEWFKNEYGIPMSPDKKAVWDRIIKSK